MMDKEWIKKAGKRMEKWKYAAAVILAGILLMGLPFSQGKEKERGPAESVYSGEHFELSALETRLEETLSVCEGVGKIEVLLTQKTGTESVYERNYAKNGREQSDSGESETETDEESELSLVKTGSYGEQPVLIRQNYPELRGALVVCEGGNNAQIRLGVTEAVRALTGLSSESITVMKMG